MTIIEICMGSSCFSRGNDQNLATIQEFIESNGLKATVKIRGSLCMEACQRGPHITIDGQKHEGVDPNSCLDILREHFNK